MERYEGKKVVIIGGTSGMGLATAKMLLDGGARVLVTGRSQAGLESAQKELGKSALVVSSDGSKGTDGTFPRGARARTERFRIATLHDGVGYVRGNVPSVPSSHRRQMSIFSTAEKPNRFPSLIQHHLSEQPYIRWCCVDSLRPPR
jgi:NAD(P)-dependent dehydrogenase (short-subunit alcohol dehydrogenase family)